MLGVVILQRLESHGLERGSKALTVLPGWWGAMEETSDNRSLFIGSGVGERPVSGINHIFIYKVRS